MTYVEITQGVNPKFQNRLNQSVIFNYLRHHGPAYKSQIAQALNISIPAVSRAVTTLQQSEFVEEIVRQKSRNGRNVSFYRASVRNGFIVGIDLLNLSLSVRILGSKEETIHFTLERSGEPIPKVIENAINKEVAVLVQEGKVRSLRDLKAIGIGSPGIVDVATGVIKNVDFHPDLQGVDLKRSLEKVFRKPVFVDNVVNLSAFAEYQRLKDKKIKNILCFDLGFEIGAGIIIGGQVYRGSGCTAGELGGMVGQDGSAGAALPKAERSHSFIWLCQQAADRLGIASDYENYAAKSENLRVVKRVFEQSSSGNTVAREIVSRYLEKVGVLIANLHAIFDADAIVIGGDICILPGLEERILPALNAVLTRVGSFSPPRITASSYGNLSALTGALDAAFEIFMTNKFPYLMR